MQNFVVKEWLKWECSEKQKKTFLLEEIMESENRTFWNGMVTVVVHSLSCAQLFVTPWAAKHEASLSCTTSQSLCKSMSTEINRYTLYM